MEPILLVTVALQVLSPFFKKAGDKFAEKIGEDVWRWIKMSFSGKKEPELPSTDGTGEEELKAVLFDRLSSDNKFRAELEEAIREAQSKLGIYHGLHVENSDKVEKQINIQNNTGNIIM